MNEQRKPQDTKIIAYLKDWLAAYRTAETNMQRGCLGLIFVAIASTAALVVLIGGGFLYNAITGVKPEPPRDRSFLACDHFRNVLADADVLTPQELRVKLQEVEGNANIATPAVQRSARDLLVAATAGSTQGVTQAGGELLAACRAAGV
jgi:hypothetical protein